MLGKGGKCRVRQEIAGWHDETVELVWLLEAEWVLIETLSVGKGKWDGGAACSGHCNMSWNAHACDQWARAVKVARRDQTSGLCT